MFKNQRSALNIYMNVYYSNGEKKDIIHFYNDIYIKVMKEYIIAMKPQTAGGPTDQNTNPVSNLGSRTPIINR